MTLFFASPERAAESPVARALIAGVPLVAANDNGAAGQGKSNAGDNNLLHAALRHFAEHGLSAAKVAGDNARVAHMAGDAGECDSWLAICRALDRRLAAATARRLGRAG